MYKAIYINSVLTSKKVASIDDLFEPFTYIPIPTQSHSDFFLLSYHNLLSSSSSYTQRIRLIVWWYLSHSKFLCFLWWMKRESHHQRRTRVPLPQGHYSQGAPLLQTLLSLEAYLKRVLHLLPNAIIIIFLGASHRRTLPLAANAPN